MRDILEELYNGAYRPSFHPSKEYCQIRDEQSALLDKVERAFSWNFVNDLETGEGLLHAEEELNAFRHGFHLGAALMLELLYPPPQSV